MTESDGSGEGLLAHVSHAWAGRFEVIRPIGSGAVAHVFLARDLRLGREVAIKVLKPEVANLVGTKRFLREIEVEASFQHPNILPLYESGDADGLPYFVTPYVAGGSLADRMAREGPLPIPEALRIVKEVAKALGAAHGRGIVHRDVKPANILLDGDRPLVADFGLAKAASEAGDHGLTATGVTLGTPGYTSPEQGTAGEVDDRTDVYALACVLHEMLTGELLFDGSSARAILSKHIAAPPTPVRSLRPSVPEGVERAILRALHKTPADRPRSMKEFVSDLEAGAVERPAVSDSGAGGVARRALANPVAAAAGLGLLVGGAFGLSTVLRPPGPPWTDRPSSVVVLPFEEPGSTEEERAFAVELAGAITEELHNWDGMRAFDRVETAGPRRELGLDSPTLERVEDGRALADALGAEALVVVTASIDSASAYLVTSLFDAESGDRVKGPVASSGPLESPADLGLVAPPVAAVLGIDSAPDPHRAIAAGTRSPEAAIEYLLGLGELERNRLQPAEVRLRSALAIDPDFTLAMTGLGQTLYWRLQEASRPPAELGLEISRLSTTAMASTAGLSPENVQRVSAFYAFQLGDYDTARERFRAILASAPTDLHALSLLGETDIHDPWMAPDAGGDYSPRRSLNRARDAFLSAVRIDPTFELAYSRLFAIQRALEAPLTGGGCPGFDEPRDEIIPVWQDEWMPTATAASFCPVALDSIAWVPWEEFMSADKALFREGADRLFRQAVSELERWASFVPGQPRPLEEIANALVLRRAQESMVSPVRLRALADDALGAATGALALKSDTVAEDLARLANLHLAAGQVDSALAAADRALAYYSDTTDESLDSAPDELINVLITVGRTAEALEIASGYSAPQYVEDRDGRLIEIDGAEPMIRRLQVLGALGVRGSSVSDELERIEAVWAGARKTEHEQQVLHEQTAAFRIATSLAFDPVALRYWGESGMIAHPLWVALGGTNADATLRSAAFEEAKAVEVRASPAVRAFLLGVAAGGLGHDREAIRLYSQLDSIPHRVDAFDPGWGLQVTSLFLRARHYRDLGDRAASLDHYARFVDARSRSDSLSTPLLDLAREAVARAPGSTR